MDLRGYQRMAAETSRLTHGGPHGAIVPLLGLAGETGSILNVYKQYLRDGIDLLHAYPLMGDFMAYQTAIDLNYSALLNFSENEFTQAGPGSLRGMKKAFASLGDYRPAEVIRWMVENQEAEFARLDVPFKGLWGRQLHAIDCQGLFCELDKYCRVAVPELTSGRKRIKARFTRSRDAIQLYFPPKWGINDKLPRAPVLGQPADEEEDAQATLL